ncbi:MAG: trehalose-phosphatase [Nitrospirae bacterium CG_4_10_14_3_um_filter_44_29]|nr:trehalose-phosphatase [Nitrospirota bacterium]PIP70576.1 MAG: trehalose-phosphatase [Nitrospirae bacterium CG22_combo_CG10-13_8_21_14_all_44_11]PIV40263.1 MAG: trehalose-phosphatase [Nitrospirae bacterium CG02_land_8_20_14_3_00_44_33]PIV65672.1 MAG: trehalose-phosphatase [Nitrospirae bacterium CG01_land_8_20_14_3_00_44_22]PIW88656.1 MAG: trehalose-phosphatase [Nitrospirae bacterium CG_4_8_14_3_um_filter_44_28]PIX89784.1 MAG: trehalose-phosphatase [Nitrospirae bacterium CG_4_10_14_3_um_filte
MKKPTYFFKKSHFTLLHDRIKTAPKIALFLDFDGTLVPIQKDPARCFLSEETKKQLRSIAGSQNCCLSILSGRMLSDIKKRVGIHKIYYGGNHGLDISGPDIRYTHPKALSAKPVIRDIKHLLQKEIAGIKGAWLEDKKFTLSLHFRSVEKGDISSVKRAFYKTVDRFIEKKLMAVIKGKKVLELAPYISWDKGKAALLILKAMKDKCFPIYIGDDQTDENAFRALNKKGITIRVGKSAKTAADYYLKGYWEVPRALDMLTITKQSAGIYEKKSP